MKLSRIAQLYPYLRAPEDGVGDSTGAGAGAGGEAPPPDPPARTFSQAEVDRIVQKRLKGNGDLQERLTALEARNEELSGSAAELATLKEEHELAGASEIEKLTARHKRATDAHASQLEQANAATAAAAKMAEDRAVTLRDTVIRQSVGEGFIKAKVLGSAASDAIKSFMSVAEIDLDDSGQVAAIEFGGISYTKVEDAAAAFLKARPYFGQAPSGGSGTPGFSGPPGKKVEGQTADELLSTGWNSPPTGRKTRDPYPDK